MYVEKSVEFLKIPAAKGTNHFCARVSIRSGSEFSSYFPWGRVKHTTEKNRMDSLLGISQILSKVSNRRQLNEISSESATKIEIYLNERFEDSLTSQALHESSQRDQSKPIFRN